MPLLPKLPKIMMKERRYALFSSLLNAIAVGLGNILPALVPTVALLLTEKYESNAYAVVAAIISVMAVVLGFVCCKSQTAFTSLKGAFESACSEKQP